MQHQVDVAIIGAGSAGLNARRAVIAAGASFEIFDPGPLGTTCARVGCMPSKLLIAAAEAAHDAHKAKVFGVHADVQVEPAEVMARVRRMRDGFVSHTREGIDAVGPVVAKQARFIGPTSLEAGGERYDVKSVVIATGSEPVIPRPWLEFEREVLTTDEVFELPELPSSLLVVGAGIIGLELGQAMHRLGVRVTVLDVSGALAGLSDPEHVEIMRAHLGVDLHLRHQLQSIQRSEEGLRVRFVGDDGAARDDTWERVLIAAGRSPRLKGLDLAAAGLDPLPEIDPLTGRLGDSAVFIAGDATGERMLLHEASYEGSVAGANAAMFPELSPQPRKTALGVVFTDPQIATVGERTAFVGTFDMTGQSRAKVMARNAGRIEVYANEDRRLTGATIIGPHAEHLGHLLAWAVEAGFDVDRALEMPFYHPVLEEGVRSALRDLSRHARR